MSIEKISTKLVVLGAGPGGYAGAFRAADLGIPTVLVDSEVNPGGVCLYKGCIPSKALLHVAELLNETKHAEAFGLEFSKPKINLDRLREFKHSVIQKLTGGLGALTKQRKINYVQGQGTLVDAHHLRVVNNKGVEVHIEFENLMIATGSRPSVVPDWPIDSPHLWNSTKALDLECIPKNLLVVGGGYIGLEMGTVYQALGSEVSVVEMSSGFLPGADRDLVAPLQKNLTPKLKEVFLDTKVLKIEENKKKGLKVTFENKEGTFDREYEKVLFSIGRKPNSSGLGLNNTKVVINERGFIGIDKQGRTTEPHIFAIGDVAGDPMLAHKAAHEAIVAAEVIAGHKVYFEPYAIPAVVFTDPEIAWCGLTQTQAEKEGRDVAVAKFPWAASGRSLTLDRAEGLTKLIVDKQTERILGVGIVGPRAGDLISEGVLAIEMGATAMDLALTIHPHPTLSETMMEAAEVFYGQSVHIYKPKRG